MTTDQISTRSQLIVFRRQLLPAHRAARDIQLCNWDEVCEQDNKRGGVGGLDRQKREEMKGEERERKRRKAVSLAPRLEAGAAAEEGEKNAKTTETHLPWISREECG